MTELIYCADGNASYARVALEHGFTYGAQLPNTVYFQPEFADQNWRKPDRVKYMAALKQYRPRMATVLDWEHEGQADEVMAWAEEAAQYVNTVIIIPKVFGTIPRIPDTVRGKPVRLGYSVPTRFAGTEVPVWEFGRRPVHLLGGSPQRQLALAKYLNVVSIDGNYAAKLARVCANFAAPGGSANWANDRHFPQLIEVGLESPRGRDLLAWRLSCMNIAAAWKGCGAYIRYAHAGDIPSIKCISDQYKQELGFVNRTALVESIARRELLVACYGTLVVGFVHYHARRDGWNTIYEIAVDRTRKGEHIGAGLLAAVPHPTRLKVTTDNHHAIRFYTKQGMVWRRLEHGKRRKLLIMERGENAIPKMERIR